MSRVRLTLQRIQEFSCPPGRRQSFLKDTTSPHLAVRATIGGARSFIFRSKFDGRTLRTTIGDVRDWDLDEARAEARRLQVLVDRRIDPRELVREDKQRKVDEALAKAKIAEDELRRQHYTLRALGEAYVRYLDAQGKGADEVRSAWKCHVNRYPEIAGKPASDVTSLEIAKLVRNVAQAGKQRTAGLVRSYLLAAYNAARRAPFSAKLPAEFIDFAVKDNPVEPIPTIPVNRGTRTLSESELAAYYAKLGDTIIDQALKLALLAGGQRMAQLLRARVADYDPSTQTLVLFDGKGRRSTPREHRIPLGPKGAALAAALAASARGRTVDYLFQTRSAAVMSNATPGKRLVEIRQTMGEVEHFDLGDIRRTVETMLAGMGVSRDVRAQLLSHGISGVQAAHYDRHSYADEKRAALVAWEARLQQIAMSGNVASVPRAEQVREPEPQEASDTVTPEPIAP